MKSELSILKNLQKSIKDIKWICLISGSQISKIGEPEGIKPILEILEKVKQIYQEETPYFKGFISDNKEKIIFFTYEDVYLIIKGAANMSISIIEDIMDIPSFLKKRVIPTKNKNIAMVPSEFWEEIEREMTVKVGPMARFLIEENLKNMSRTRDTISISELPYFIESLCKETEDEELKSKLIDIMNKTLTNI